jgi:uncharacterized protein involved in oxidation of intracellular sulfur
MRHLVIINDAPYGTEKAYNGFRLAMSIQGERPEDGVRVFLMADAVGCGLPGQEVPDGYYSIERMLKGVLAKGGEVRACGTCAKARGMAGLKLIDGVVIGTMADLTEWVATSDRVVSF